MDLPDEISYRLAKAPCYENEQGPGGEVGAWAQMKSLGLWELDCMKIQERKAKRKKKR